jgi:hypothetical protein
MNKATSRASIRETRELLQLTDAFTNQSIGQVQTRGVTTTTASTVVEFIS